MEEKVQPKFVLPSPKFDKPNGAAKANHLYLTPSGMTLLPRAKQPPPMYGARGSTVPAKYLAQENFTAQSSAVSVPETPPIHHSPPRPEFCHSCGMELANVQDMKRHLEQHESCPADDCDFSALHNVLERHIEANHITGAYKKVKKVWTDEELAAWRTERRKRFPTATNVELARLAKEQRIKRGERLEASKSRFGNREDRQRTRPKGDHKERFDPKNRRKRGIKGKSFEKKKPAGSTNQVTDKSKETKKVIKATEEIQSDQKEERPNFTENGKFRGTGSMEDYQHVKPKVHKKDNALFGLLGMYGSDSEEESESECEDQGQQVGAIQDKDIQLGVVKVEPHEHTASSPSHDDSPQKLEIKIAKEGLHTETSQDDANRDEQTRDEPTPTLESSAQKHIDRISASILESESPTREEAASSDEAPDEEPFQRTTETISEPTPPKAEPKECKLTTAPKRAAPKRVYGLNYKRARKQTQQNTMLSKLLESEIRHERNVLLQCVRHVCEMNFFGIGQTKEKKSVASDRDQDEEKLEPICDKSVCISPDAL
ncbi:FMR1-interacting protein NUFIP1 [Drosophila biarmipes]|uniref:FMR1-interacting protein NUFIP1 n=1 Tax=Drosophila biarmipes TaxID=125945 RepID=UPI0007E871DB|nr:FMR1-interacting protein NUFIP1 [Drosophila biarmipes]